MGSKNKRKHKERIEEQTRLLETIRENPEARKEIEEFIKENFDRPYKGSNIKNPLIALARGILKDLRELGNGMEGRFGIETEASILYAFLDKRLSKKIAYLGREFKEKFSMAFEDESGAHPFSFELNGGEYERAYRNEREDVINFLYANVSLFPDSAQKYIRKKIKEADENPKLEKIRNPFEAKTLASSMEKKFKLSQAKHFLSFFKKIENEGEKISTLGYFHKAISDRYPDSEAAREFTKKIADDIFELIERRFDFGLEQLARKKEWEPVRDMMKHVDSIRAHIFKNIYATTNDICFIIETLAKTEEEKTKIEKLQWGRTKHKLNVNNFYFSDCDEDTQKILFKESKRQFFHNNPGYA